MNRIPVFFMLEMVAPALHSIAPGTFKPGACVEDWARAGLPVEVRDFVPAGRADLCRAHRGEYVDGILAGRIRNGFGGTEPEVARSLPYTTGAMMAAAEEAVLGDGVACAPVSGFHHAHWDESSGFCIFNGLMVAALHLLSNHYVRRVGILDLDQHWGDGTEAIIQQLGVRTRIRHDSPGLDHRGPEDAPGFLKGLAKRVEVFADCQVLLYQAGADPHINDPLGGWMTDEQLEQRDRIVFETARDMRLPVAWNLAGGYQRDEAGTIEPVLAIHRRTMSACAAVYLD